MNKRGWLASGLLAAVVIGGYLGLLPLLSSLASGPAWPEPIATRDASGIVTAVGPTAGNDEPVAPATTGSDQVVDNKPPAPANGDGKTVSPDKAEVVRVVGGGIERVTKPKKARRGGSAATSGAGGAGSLAASGNSSGSSGSSSSGSSGGGSSAPAPAPRTVPAGIDGIGAGQLAGGGSGAGLGSDDEVTAGG
jgi:hypothetical protein